MIDRCLDGILWVGSYRLDFTALVDGVVLLLAVAMFARLVRVLFCDFPHVRIKRAWLVIIGSVVLAGLVGFVGWRLLDPGVRQLCTPGVGSVLGQEAASFAAVKLASTLFTQGDGVVVRAFATLAAICFVLTEFYRRRKAER